jgi:hypothetical protein
VQKGGNMGAQGSRYTRYRAEILSALFSMALLAAPPLQAQDVSMAGDARGGLGDEGVVLWFASMMRTKGVTANTPVTICIKNQSISWREGKTTKTLKVPDAKVAFKPWESSSHTYFGRSWDTSHPPSISQADTFMAGVSFPLPQGLPRGMKDVTWQGKFESDARGITVQWKWAALAYSHFMEDYNDLDVALADTDLGRLAGKALAGTPVRVRSYLRHLNDDEDDGVVFLGVGARAAIAVPKTTTCGGFY